MAFDYTTTWIPYFGTTGSTTAAKPSYEPFTSSSPEPQPVTSSSPEPQPFTSSSPEPQPFTSSSPEPQPVTSSSPEPQDHRLAIGLGVGVPLAVLLIALHVAAIVILLKRRRQSINKGLSASKEQRNVENDTEENPRYQLPRIPKGPVYDTPEPAVYSNTLAEEDVYVNMDVAISQPSSHQSESLYETVIFSPTSNTVYQKSLVEWGVTHRQ